MIGLGQFHEHIDQPLSQAGFTPDEVSDAKPLLYGPNWEPMGVEVDLVEKEWRDLSLLDEERSVFSRHVAAILDQHDAILIRWFDPKIQVDVIKSLTKRQVIFYHNDEGGPDDWTVYRVFHSPEWSSRESHLLSHIDVVWPIFMSDPKIRATYWWRTARTHLRMSRWAQLNIFWYNLLDRPEEWARAIERVHEQIDEWSYREVEYTRDGSQTLILRLWNWKTLHGKMQWPEERRWVFYSQDFVPSS